MQLHLEEVKVEMREAKDIATKAIDLPTDIMGDVVDLHDAVMQQVLKLERLHGLGQSKSLNPVASVQRMEIVNTKSKVITPSWRSGSGT